MTEIKLEDNDFGFSSGKAEVTSTKKIKDDRAEKMYNAIIPFLNNLMKDSDTSDTIHWPNRKEKIESFIQKLEKILNS